MVNMCSRHKPEHYLGVALPHSGGLTAIISAKIWVHTHSHNMIMMVMLMCQINNTNNIREKGG